MTGPVVVAFPLRGEWAALNTPADKVPSHGTDYFGQRYAFDFVRLGENGLMYRRSLFHHLAGLLTVEDCFAWDQPVYPPFKATVIAAADGWPDRLRLNAIIDLARASLGPDRSSPDNYRPLTGNFVLLEGTTAFALVGHLRRDSILVRAGDRVTTDSVLGRVGNSGNTTAPHLHFQLMDGPDPYTATGLPCAFERYEAWRDRRWEEVRNGIPQLFERIRV